MAQGPVKLANGNLLVPVRLEAEGVLGDGMQVIGPDHPDYQDWLPHAADSTSSAS